MATSIDVRQDGQYVEVVHRGTLTREELEDARAQTARLLSEHGLMRLLIDGRAADVSSLSNLDVFEFSAGHVSTLPSIGTLRMALVVPDEHAQTARFVETVAQNRGVNLCVFLDADTARGWLTNVDGE